MYTFTDPARSAPRPSSVQTKEFDSDAFLSFLNDLLTEIDERVGKESQTAKGRKSEVVSQAVLHDLERLSTKSLLILFINIYLSKTF